MATRLEKSCYKHGDGKTLRFQLSRAMSASSLKRLIVTGAGFIRFDKAHTLPSRGATFVRSYRGELGYGKAFGMVSGAPDGQ